MYIIYTNLLATARAWCALVFTYGGRAAKASRRITAEHWRENRLVFCKLTSHWTSVGHAVGPRVTLRSKTPKAGNALPGNTGNTMQRH